MLNTISFQTLTINFYITFTVYSARSRFSSKTRNEDRKENSLFSTNLFNYSELALYVLPKGVDSLYRVLYNRKWMVRIPGFEVMMFSMGMGLIVSFYQTEHECMSTVFYRLFDRINLAIDDEEIRNQQKVESKGK